MTSKIVSLIKETAREKNLCTFEYVLSEANKMAGSGDKGIEHTKKYVEGQANDPTSRKIKQLITDYKSSPKNFDIAKNSPLRLSDAHESADGKTILPKDSYLIPHHEPETYGGENKEYETVNGTKKIKVLHSKFHVHDKDGNYLGVHEIPHTSVIKETHHTGKYNYEYAFNRLYNHMSSIRDKFKDEKGKIRKPTIDEVKKEIENGKTDENHPLHINQADQTHFFGGLPDQKEESEKYKKSKDTHDGSFHEVHVAVHNLIHHPDFRTNWARRQILINSGKSLSQASPLAKVVHGGKVSSPSLTHKADTFTWEDPQSQLKEEINEGPKGITVIRKPSLRISKRAKKISLKMASAQLHSGGGADSEILLRAANNEYHDRHMHDIEFTKFNPISDINITKSNDLIKHGNKEGNFNFEHASNVISHIRHHMDNGNIEITQKLMKHLHDNMPRKNKKESFLRRVYHHAASGQAKFAGKKGTATHVTETGKRGSTHTIGEYLDLGEKSGQLTLGRFRKGKHGASSKGLTWSIPTFNSRNFKPDIKNPTSSLRQKKLKTRVIKKKK